MLPAHSTFPTPHSAVPRLLVTVMLLSLAGCGGGSDSGSSLRPIDSVSRLPAVPGWAQFTYPTSGQLSVQAAHPFTWTAVSGAQGYQLQVGTSFGANDVFDSGVITTTSVVVPKLPACG